ncbi:MAG: peroxide stress protein YaaA [Gammaproteobacteria bacterium]|nr:MAG: peroxide stress protein YaaA [Gammaproteobacteria bacterium]UCH41642.1 MAG: peroxide stress protein YaaA [Gammaproteobacteria bacterium]
MLTVISPAKTLDYDTPTVTDSFTQPAHLTQSRKLIKRLRELSATDLSSLMHISDGLAELNQQRFKQWKTPFKPENARQALFAFKGDVYLGLDAYSLNPDNVEFAQDHLRILSGLYGLLRPLDLMQPYRLEMGTRLDTEQGSNLYQFWDDRITRSLNQELKQSDTRTLINLASTEYFKSIKPKQLQADIITPAFKEYRDGQYKFIQFFAKKARGLMARYIIDNRIDDSEGLKDFNYEGYGYKPSLSNEREWVFTRRQ